MDINRNLSKSVSAVYRDYCSRILTARPIHDWARNNCDSAAVKDMAEEHKSRPIVQLTAQTILETLGQSGLIK